MSYLGFKKLKSKLAKQKGAKNAGAIAASVMHKKYKEKDIKSHQKSGTSMKNAPHKKHFG